MANFTKTISHSDGIRSSSLSYTKAYDQYIYNDIIVDDGDKGTVLLNVDPEGRLNSQDWSDIKAVVVSCVSRQPVEVWVKLSNWTNDTTQSGNEFIHTILTRGEFISIPNAKMITFDGGFSACNGSTVTQTTSSPTTSGLTTSASTIGVSDTTFTTTTDASNDLQAGDYITIGSGAEIMRVVKVATTTITVDRGQFFTATTTHSASQAVNYYFITDANGISNWRGNPNDLATQTKFWGTSFTGGLVSGSIGVRFFNPPYQELGLFNITSSTDTKLTVSTAYAFKVTINGVAYDNNSFTTDASNTNWGGTNGVLTKIQNVMDTNKIPCTVGIIGGDIRFTSKIATNGGAIALADPTTGTSVFGVGDVPDKDSLDGAIDAVLDNAYGDEFYSASNYMFDDGKGKLYRVNGGSGSINYDDGAMKIISAPPLRQFNISISKDSALDGMVDLDASKNYIQQINARSVNAVQDGKVRVVGYY